MHVSTVAVFFRVLGEPGRLDVVLLTPPARPVIVLVHSPLIGPASWGAVPATFGALGIDVVTVDVRPASNGDPPGTFISQASVAIGAALSAGTERVLLVGQHEAGPLLPHLGAAQQAAGRAVTGYVLLNALLPKPYGARGANSMLDLIEAGDSGRADALRGLLLDGVRFPNWQSADLAPLIDDTRYLDAVVADTYPRDLAWYAAPIPFVGEWPNAPVTYIQSGPECAWEARQAGLRGWQVLGCGGGTFASINEPKQVVAAIDSVVMNG
jgi:hypothetical protein